MRCVTAIVKIASRRRVRSSSTRRRGTCRPPDGGTLSPVHRNGRWEWEVVAMADIAYVLLLVGGFLVLALTLRGLERL